MYGFNGNEIILLLTHNKLLTFSLNNIGSHEPQRKHLWKYICELKPENRLFVEFNDLKSSIYSNQYMCTPQIFEVVGVWSFDQYISQFTFNIGYNNSNYSNPQSILLHNKLLLPITICCHLKKNYIVPWIPRCTEVTCSNETHQY